MITSYSINVRGIGPVLFEKSKRAKRVIISIKTTNTVRVAVPYRISFKKAETFMFANTDWIKQHLEKVRQYESESTTIQYHFDDIDKSEAKKTLTGRLVLLAEKYGFEYSKVTIRCQRTRWGSCSIKNNISLNMKLVKLPLELADYIMLHELVHTRIHSHNKKFWEELDKYVGNAHFMAKRLRLNTLGMV